MPRTWGYIIVVLAALAGVGSLMLATPEEIVVEKPEPPPAPTPPKVTRPMTPQSPGAARPAKKAPSQPTPPPAPPAAKTEPPTPPRTFPMQDTTKTRTMVQPKAPEN